MKLKRETLFSLAGALIGSLCVLLVILGINGLEGMKRKKGVSKAVAFAVNKTKKKKNSNKNTIKRKPKKKSRPKAPAPILAGGLSGASFGLDQFEFLGEMGDGLLGDSSNAVMTEDTVDVLPIVRYRAPLEYPSDARRKNIEGEVTMNLLVGTAGEVVDIKLLSATPTGIFDQVALNSARGWQFEAAKYQGKNVKIWVRQKISFSLN